MAKNPKVFVGDHGPVSVMQNGLQVAGAVKEPMTGEGNVGWDAPYKADIPAVKVYGKGRQKTLTGKNLIPFPYYADVVEKNGVSYTANPDGSISIKGIPTDYSAFTLVRQYNIPSKVFDITFSKINIQGVVWQILCYDSNGDVIHIYQRSDKYTLHISDYPNLSYLQIEVKRQENNISIDGTLYPQLEIGLVSTPYEPYCGGIPAPNPEYPIEPEFLEMAEIACRGRNLCLLDREKLQSKPPFTVNVLNDNQVSFTNNSAGNANPSMYWKKIPPGKYVYMIKFTDGRDAYLQFKKGEGYHRVLKSGIPKVFDTPETDFIRIISAGIPSKSTETYTLYIGYDYFRFEPYFSGGSTQLPILRALTDSSVRDEIDLETGKITRKIAEHTITGNENWFWYKLNDYGAYCYWFPLENIVMDYGAAISNKYISENNCWDTEPANYISSHPSLTRIYFNTTYATVDDLKSDFAKQYDSGNPVKVWYALETPIIEHVDPAILKQHPGYTQLIQQGGFEPTQIDVTPYTELAFPEKNSK